ncbi:uncharacterized protein SCHCODRAFT_02572448 [Schizophyllum commune H4-8]|uniref:uncharacterized protein n=1 Tax=Schizophyllum commune (strain H4-8 / FGSC 9210) TaxID=578458 RepID=UPI00215E2409|nr:uncharacterized protein SCHCODRAFT_02572448 [Schizophyllum commune H4-8]KAI5895199.1 hypothetical protein SCHCODRAFT_02572448 [Schizophyllum commune H4-8]
MSNRKSKLEQLAELKRVRAGGKRVLKQEEDTEIYDEVSEEQYRAIVRGRLQEDDFVEDDGVDGYMDTGVEEWEATRDYDDDEEDDRRRDKKSKKSAKGKAKAKPPPPPQPAPSMNAYRPKVTEEQEQDFMANLLGELDTVPVKPALTTRTSRKRKPAPSPERKSSTDKYRYRERDREVPPSSSPIASDYPDTSSDGLAPLEDEDEPIRSPTKRPRTEATTMAATTNSLAAMDFDDITMDDLNDWDNDMDFDFPAKPKVDPPPAKPEVLVDKKPFPSANATPAKPKEKEIDTKPSWINVYESLNVAETDKLGPSTTTHTSAQHAGIDALEPDGSLRFFWLDYLELNGNVYFIGKLKDKKTNQWHSCCVTVENIERNLFVLPREKRVEQGSDGEIYDTDEPVEMEDVYNDFDMIRGALKIKQWKGKFVKRKYAFGDKEVPRGESTWLKVVYPFTEPTIPMDAISPNILKIFGTNTSAFELLVLKRKIMGPCWLQIKNPDVNFKGVSWCKFEATVSDPKDINPFPETDHQAPKETPPLTVMSLSVRTIVNHVQNKREIVCATARIWHNLDIDDPTPPERLPCTVQTFVRPLDKFPPRFEACAKQNMRGTITAAKNERMLLSSLLIALHRADADVIVGHDFVGVTLDVLLTRMKELTVDHWSRIGRFRRSKWPHIGKEGTNIRFMNGRMLCDLSSDGAKSMIPSTTWSMTEMCKTHLKVERQDIDPDDTASYFDGSVSNPDRLLTFVRHCELDAHLQMAIAAKVQILPLTKQLTQLAGNSWNKTLNGGRAERNEYILLHEFHRLKYICPDKTYGKKAAPVREDPDEEGGGTSKKGAKRDKYKGGLVLAPKRQLWETYILVMDFNSLYPSIIQEYNIDFTTVSRVDDDTPDDEAELPSSEAGQGVLPRLIATLVSRRRQVKNLMKDKNVTQAQYLQYDIKQQALKLTANSMYGCLGFEYSRFYARPLAALTTRQGREILTNTAELAGTMNLDVVYGDTDSVFVNSNQTELSKALKIANEFKKAVNDRYRLLEIDLDGVFQRLLLLQKKKYAAIKVDGSTTTTEIKGLDMKRREYSQLSKRVSQYVLDRILSGEPTEIVVEEIHEYLAKIGEDVRGGKVPLDEFIIFKRLGKNPEDYPDAKSQPHVQVALRMKAKGSSARAGDVIPYVFCLPEGEETAGKTSQADRAKHPDDVRRSGSGLIIDYEHYLSQQVLPPIERLCEPIEGTDRARLAECLGLDPQRYKVSNSASDELSISTLETQMSDRERFKDCVAFFVRCRKCKATDVFARLNEQTVDPTGVPRDPMLHPDGAKCTACQEKLQPWSLEMQLQAQIRGFITRYYEGWTVCDDPTCGQRTRRMGVYGHNCVREGCQGKVSFEYTDAQLYTQLKYFSSLFDVEKAFEIAKSKGNARVEHDKVQGLAAGNVVLLDTLRACTDRYLDMCGRRWVSLNNLFSFMTM